MSADPDLRALVEQAIAGTLTAGEVNELRAVLGPVGATRLLTRAAPSPAE
jgi:hypothetical protein